MHTLQWYLNLFANTKRDFDTKHAIRLDWLLHNIKELYHMVVHVGNVSSTIDYNRIPMVLLDTCFYGKI